MRAYRTRLLEMRTQLLSSSRDLAKEALQSGGGEFSVDHMADHGSDNFEQDFNLKLLEGEAGQLEDIRDALLKIEGTHELPFGLCEACSDSPQGLCPTCPWIPASRLDVIPQARLCVQTKESEEAKARR
jgi:RNA polymerase-binding transcription factor DksA